MGNDKHNYGEPINSEILLAELKKENLSLKIDKENLKTKNAKLRKLLNRAYLIIRGYKHGQT